MQEKLSTKTETDEGKRIEAERGNFYGPIGWNHTNIGVMWQGVLMSADWDPSKGPIPADVVCLMMAALKISRAANPHAPVLHDNYIDGQNYLDFAERLKETKEL